MIFILVQNLSKKSISDRKQKEWRSPINSSNSNKSLCQISA